jgi:hypothetical protein
MSAPTAKRCFRKYSTRHQRSATGRLFRIAAWLLTPIGVTVNGVTQLSPNFDERRSLELLHLNLHGQGIVLESSFCKNVLRKPLARQHYTVLSKHIRESSKGSASSSTRSAILPGAIVSVSAAVPRRRVPLDVAAWRTSKGVRPAS